MTASAGHRRRGRVSTGVSPRYADGRRGSHHRRSRGDRRVRPASP